MRCSNKHSIKGLFLVSWDPPTGLAYTYIYINIYIYFYFWLHWVFVAVHGLFLVVVRGGYSSLRCMGFSLRWLLLLWSTGSRHVGFSSCGMQAQ